MALAAWLIGLIALQCSILPVTSSSVPTELVRPSATFTHKTCPRVYTVNSTANFSEVSPDGCFLRCKGTNVASTGGVSLQYRNGSGLFSLPATRKLGNFTNSTNGFNVTTDGTTITADAERPLDFVTGIYVCIAKKGSVAITEEFKAAEFIFTATPPSPFGFVCGKLGHAIKIPYYSSWPAQSNLADKTNSYSLFREISYQPSVCRNLSSDDNHILSVQGDYYILPLRPNHVSQHCRWGLYLDRRTSDINPISFKEIRQKMLFYLYDTGKGDTRGCDERSVNASSSKNTSQLVHITPSPAVMSANSTGGLFYIECIILPPTLDGVVQGISTIRITWRYNGEAITESGEQFQLHPGKPYYDMRMGIRIFDYKTGNYSCETEDGGVHGEIEVLYAMGHICIHVLDKHHPN